MNFIELLDLMSESPIILAGYSFKNERAKDTFLKKVNAIDINKDFNFKKFNRANKINVLLDSEEKIDTKYLVLDLNLIPYNDSNLRIESTRRILENLRSDIIRTRYRLIVVSAMNRYTSNLSSINANLRGPIEVADLGLIINDSNKIDIIKNRRGYNSKGIAF